MKEREAKQKEWDVKVAGDDRKDVNLIPLKIILSLGSFVVGLKLESGVRKVIIITLTLNMTLVIKFSSSQVVPVSFVFLSSITSS